MAKSTPMHVLRNLAEQHLNDTTQQLVQLRQAHAIAAAQLEQLHHYEQEYGRQLQTLLSADGMPVVTLLSHQFFISSLNRVARQQAHRVAACQQSVDRTLEGWKKDKQRLNAFETLINRADAVLQLKARRQEQKMMDELAQRASLRSAGL